MRLTAYIALFASILLFCLSAQADDRKVYLNGKDISDLRNYDFRNVKVNIDGNGNIHVDAPGYGVNVVSEKSDKVTKVKKASEKTSIEKPKKVVSGDYFVASSQTSRGSTQYDISFFVNSKPVHVFKNKVEQDVIDISHFLVKGANRIDFSAIKDTEGKRLSRSPADEFRITIGIGKTEGSQMKFVKTLAEFVKTAKDTKNETKSITIYAE